MEQFNWEIIPKSNESDSISIDDTFIGKEPSIEEDISINEENEDDVELRLLGFYQLPNQNMHPESEYVEEATKLAEGLNNSFRLIDSLNGRYASLFKDIFNTSVFIFKDRDLKLYAYFPQKRIARISNVVYNRKFITKVNSSYLHWFKVGEDFFKSIDIEQPILIDRTKNKKPFFKTKVSAIERKDGIKDEFGVLYDSTNKRLISAPRDLTECQVQEGVEIICDNAFSFCNLQRIILPKSLKCIGRSAFSYCKFLNNLSLPEGLLRIQNGAFYECVSLSSINIPKSVEYIGSNPIAMCGNTNIINNSPYYFFDDSFLMNQNKDEIISYVGIKDRVTTPITIKEIGRFAFGKCQSIRHITITGGITVIEDDAFIDCTNLEEINLPESLEFIGGYAFADCYKLKNINIPDCVKFIGMGAFGLCKSLETISIPNSIEKILSSSFESCYSLRSIRLSDGLEFIGDKAFQSCTSLYSINFPKSLKRIESNAFYGCI